MISNLTNASSSSATTPQLSSEGIVIDVFVIISIVLSILILFGNGFVIFLFFYKRALLNKPSNKLLLSLAICDFISGAGVSFHLLIKVSPMFGDPGCHECFIIRMFIDIFTTFLVETSILHLCMITADRVLSLFLALRYRNIVTRAAMNPFIICTWAIPFVTSALQISYLYPLMSGNPLTEEEELEIEKIEIWYSVVSFIVYMFIPFLLIGIAFILMFREIRKLLLKTPSLGLDESRVSPQQRRVVYIFSLMYLCFATLTMPYFTLRLILDLNNSIDVSPLVFNITYTCKTATSLCNPILYSAMNREFRSIAGLWMQRTQIKISHQVRKISNVPSYLHASIKRRSFARSSFSEQGRPNDSGIFEGGTPDTLNSTIIITTPRLSNCSLLSYRSNIETIL